MDVCIHVDSFRVQRECSAPAVFKRAVARNVSALFPLGVARRNLKLSWSRRFRQPALLRIAWAWHLVLNRPPHYRQLECSRRAGDTNAYKLLLRLAEPATRANPLRPHIQAGERFLDQPIRTARLLASHSTAARTAGGFAAGKGRVPIYLSDGQHSPACDPHVSEFPFHSDAAALRRPVHRLSLRSCFQSWGVLMHVFTA